MILYIDVLSIILILRSLFIIAHYKSGTKHLRFYKHATDNYGPWAYRLLGLSVLWAIVRYLKEYV